MLSIRPDELQMISDHIQKHYGINLSAKKTLVESRLNNILSERGYSSFGEYFQTVLGDSTSQEISLLLDRLTTNHTFFMREASHFVFFNEVVLPWLESSVKDRDLRIWSAGCSSGEEPYTLAMLLSDFFTAEKGLWDRRLLATDISSQVLRKAGEGLYPSDSVESLPPMWRFNYFNKESNGNFRISKQIQDQVTFRSFNLMESQFPFKRKFHVIFCRNVMIYFDAKTKEELVRKFYESTVPGGYLFIGHSESIPREGPYRYVMPAVYQKC